MSRTKRNVNRNSCGCEYSDLKRYEKEWGPGYIDWVHKSLLIFGTDAGNNGYKTHEYYNRAHRLGRADARAQLRPQRVLSEDYDFDPSNYDAKYKSVWWDIF